MNPKQTSRLRSLLLLSLAVLAACSKPAPEASAPTPESAAASTAAPPAPAVSAEVQAMGADQLREAASKALDENRIYAPGGNNAVEYYLALRDKTPQDPAVASALTDLLPYTVIAAEQSLARENFPEAQRLVALIEKADAKAPALPRLKQSIAASQQAATQRELDASKNAEQQAKLAEEKRLAALKTAADQQAAQQQAAQQLATQRAAEQARPQEPTRTAPANPPPAPAAAAAAPTTAPANNPPPSQPAETPSAAPTLRAISQPPPRYPADALRAGTSGEVLVEFTVGTDGSVTSARVVRSTPPRVFDREAVNAAKRWKFAPISAPTTTRRTINFNPR